MNINGCKCQAYPSIEYDPESNEERQFIQQFLQQPQEEDNINIFINGHDMSIFDQDVRKTLDLVYEQLDFDINNSISNITDLMINDDTLRYQDKQETFINPQYKKELEEAEKRKKKELKLKKVTKESKTTKSSTKSKTSTSRKSIVEDSKSKKSSRQVTVEDQEEKQEKQVQFTEQEQTQQQPQQQIEQQIQQEIQVEQQQQQQQTQKQEDVSNVIEEEDLPERKPNRSINNQTQQQMIISSDDSLIVKQEDKQVEQTQENKQQINEQQNTQEQQQQKQELHIVDYIPEKKQENIIKKQQQKVNIKKLQINQSNIFQIIQNKIQEQMQKVIKKEQEDKKKQQEQQESEKKKQQLIKTQNLKLSSKQVKFDQQIEQHDQNGKNKFNIQKIENQLIVTLNNQVVYQSDIAKLELTFNEKTNQITFGAYRQAFTKEMYKKIKNVLQQLQKQQSSKDQSKQQKDSNIKQMIYIDDYDSISIFNAKKRVEQTLSLSNAQQIQTQKYIIYKQSTGESIGIKKYE